MVAMAKNGQQCSTVIAARWPLTPSFRYGLRGCASSRYVRENVGIDGRMYVRTCIKMHVIEHARIHVRIQVRNMSTYLSEHRPKLSVRENDRIYKCQQHVRKILRINMSGSLTRCMSEHFCSTYGRELASEQGCHTSYHGGNHSTQRVFSSD